MTKKTGTITLRRDLFLKVRGIKNDKDFDDYNQVVEYLLSHS